MQRFIPGFRLLFRIFVFYCVFCLPWLNACSSPSPNKGGGTTESPTPPIEAPPSPTPPPTAEATPTSTPLQEEFSDEITLDAQLNPFNYQSFTFEIHLPSDLLQEGNPPLLVCDEDASDPERHVKEGELQTSQTLTLYGFKASTRYECFVEVEDTDTLKTSEVIGIETPALPTELNRIEITIPSSNAEATGYTLVGYGEQTQNWDYMSDYTIIFDAEGEIRWYWSGYSAGDIDISFVNESVYGRDAIARGGQGGDYVVPNLLSLDGTTLMTATTEKVTSTEYSGAFHHDAGISADGTSFFALVKQSAVNSETGGSYTGFIIKEIDLLSGDNVWYWDSTGDGVEQGELPEGSDSNPDPYHANAIWDNREDGHLYLYVSLRSLHRVLKIDYDTRQIVWSLGIDQDFILLEKDGSPAEDGRWFFHQHDAQRHGNRLTVYDNGKGKQNYGYDDWFTRVAEFELDEENMTATLIYEYNESNWKEPVWGGYDTLEDGRRLIARAHCAVCVTADENNPSSIIELAAGDTPSITWRAEFTNDLVAIYRAEHIDGCRVFNNLRYCPDGHFE